MQQDLVKDYNARVIQASKGELVVISYELLLTFIDDAKLAVEQGNKQAIKQNVTKAQKALRNLMESLDFNYEITKNLMALYLFVNEQLIKASLKVSIEPLNEGKKVIEILLSGWKEVADHEQEQPLISNGEKLYAGLTYGKGMLNETTMSNHQRGYKA